MTHSIAKSADNLHINREVVSEENEDGPEFINYPTHVDRGSVLFSLNYFDEYQDFSQDELREISRTHWTVYKQDCG